jgi:hypothetical protein
MQHGLRGQNAVTRGALLSLLLPALHKAGDLHPEVFSAVAAFSPRSLNA